MSVCGLESMLFKGGPSIPDSAGIQLGIQSRDSPLHAHLESVVHSACSPRASESMWHALLIRRGRGIHCFMPIFDQKWA